MTIIIIIVTVLISLYALNNPVILEKMLFRPYNIKHNREWWRWVTCGFIHADYMHLFVNMISFYFFGESIELVFNKIAGTSGPVLFILFYVSAIVFSSIYSYYKHQNDFGYSALGASGAVAAIIFAFILFEPFRMIYLYAILGVPAILFGIIYLFYEYVMGKRQTDNIGHDAHFYGALYGLIFPVIIYPGVIATFVSQIAEKFNLL